MTPVHSTIKLLYLYFYKDCYDSTKGRTVCVYSMVQRREKEKDTRYIQEASAPAAATVYQTYNVIYICNKANVAATE